LYRGWWLASHLPGSGRSPLKHVLTHLLAGGGYDPGPDIRLLE
jgi:hypothetical protein